MDAAKKKCSSDVNLIENTMQKKKGQRVDIVLFHGPTHHTGGDRIWRKIMSNDNQKPVLAMLSMEQPKYATVMRNQQYLKQNFDLILSYSLDSTYLNSGVPNLPITYYPLHILSPNAGM